MRSPSAVLAAAALLLAGCAAGQTPTREPTPAPSATPSTGTLRGAAQPAASTTAIGAPTGMTIPSSTKFPAVVADYHGRAGQQGWDYADATTGRSVGVVHPSSAFTYTNSVAELDDTDRPLGRLGACGYRGGRSDATMCVLRVSDGSILRLQGDAGMSYGQLVAFAVEYARATGA